MVRVLTPPPSPTKSGAWSVLRKERKSTAAGARVLATTPGGWRLLQWETRNADGERIALRVEAFGPLPPANVPTKT